MTAPEDPTPTPTPGPISWPFVVLAAIVVGATVAAPTLGANPADVLAAIGAAGGVGALVYGRQAAKQTNGSLTARMDASVQRGTADLRAELPALMRDALNLAPSPDPWAPDGGNVPEQGGQVPYPRP